VYKEDVQGVTAYLRSRCGAQNVDYAGSFYQVFFERSVDSNWQKFRGYKVAMQYDANGGSLGSDTLPLAGPGLWRMQARHVTQQKHSGVATVGEFSNWVNFWVGEPKVMLAKIDLSQLKTLSLSDSRFSGVEKRWRAGPAKAIRSADKPPASPVARTADRLTLRHKPRVATAIAVGAIHRANAPSVEIAAVNVTNKPVHGGFVDLKVTLHNKGELEVPPGTYALELQCSKTPAKGGCQYRLDSILLPALAGGETWDHDLERALKLTGIGSYEVTASIAGEKKRSAGRSVTISVRPVLKPAGKTPALKPLKPNGG
jgi:hypothetical protein